MPASMMGFLVFIIVIIINTTSQVAGVIFDGLWTCSAPLAAGR